MDKSTHAVRTRWSAIGAAVAVTIGAAGISGYNIVNADVSTGDRPVFVSINPCRLVDTRSGPNNTGPRATPIGAAETLTVTAHGDNGNCIGASAIPTDALSLAMNVTAVGPTANTFLTFWGDGANPGTSNLNPRSGAAPTPNAVNTPLSSSGTFNVFNNAGAVDVVVDVNGYYAHHDHDDRYYTETESDERFLTPAQGDEAFERFSDTMLIGPHEFQTREGFESPSEWEFGLVLEHSTPTVEEECIFAPIDLPSATVVTAVELIYSASAPVEIDSTVGGILGVPGATVEEDDIFSIIVSTNTTIPATADDTFSRHEFDLLADAGAIDSDRFNYVASICTAGEMLVAGLRLTLAPST